MRRLLWLPLALLALGGAALALDWWTALPPGRRAEYVGRQRCTECHAAEAAKWAGSDHDRAMELPNADSVVGDFDSATFSHFGVESRMFRQGDEYFVTTEGPDGQARTYPVKYTFGIRPLQQYLVETERGRLQTLPTTWDTKDKRWFHIYHDEHIKPDDELFWAGPAQNWNYMCAECHSTNLRRNYDLKTDTYHTEFSEIDVSCEACHGPGSIHVELAEAKSLFWDRHYGYGLARLKGKSSKGELNSCAPCHSRRRIVHAGYTPGDELLDYYMPELLGGEHYHVDGQIREEVYEYGSFLQSRMYREGVRCTDCHDPHSLELKAAGNQLCGQCHVPGKYDGPAHHHHPVGKAGANCVDCHMPTTNYMVVDPRRDHSIRVPRPDLTVSLGTPNACNGCHEKETPQWASDWIVKWYGPKRLHEPHYAHAIAAGRAGKPEAVDSLSKLIRRKDVGPVVRASAAALLGGYPIDETREVLARALKDDEALVRAAAAGAAENLPPDELAELLAPKLTDPVRAVRTEAARILSGVPATTLDADGRIALRAATDEYIAGQHANSDQPAAHLNLGMLAERRGDPQTAEAEYRTALRLSPRFVPALNNLAMLIHTQGKPAEAEELFRKIVELQPEFAMARYSLGLLLAESPDRLPEAIAELQTAARLEPAQARLQYNLGLALQQQHQLDEAEVALKKACELDPRMIDAWHALTLLYAERRDWDRAAETADRLTRLAPGAPAIGQLRQWIEAQRRQPQPAGPTPP
ncbi:MAG: tetratricopeptide repeat protein [Pirellulales bacterium]|nr:tetratricopeptide repeat protein [Pirellulales bacterium]